MKSALDTTLNTAHIHVEEYQKVCAKVDALKQQVDWFKRQLFGRKSEKHLVDNPDQAHLFALAFDEVLPPAPKKPVKGYARSNKQKDDNNVNDTGLRFTDEVPTQIIDVTVVCVEAERHVDDKVTTESRYYISSLSLNAERLNSIIRNHWGVENSLHWTLDMTFNEDDSRIRLANAAEVMNAFRKIVLNIVKQDKSRKASMKRKLKMAALEDDFRAKLLIGAN